MRREEERIHQEIHEKSRVRDERGEGEQRKSRRGKEGRGGEGKEKGEVTRESRG